MEGIHYNLRNPRVWKLKRRACTLDVESYQAINFMWGQLLASALRAERDPGLGTGGEVEDSAKQPTGSLLPRLQELFDTNLKYARARRRVFNEDTGSSPKRVKRFEERAWLTPDAIAKAHKVEARKRSPLTEAEVFACALASNEGLVSTDLDSGKCLNRVLALHYALDPDAIEHIPSAYTTNPNLQRALGRFFAQVLGSRTDAHVMEWASGNRVWKRWSIILEELGRSRCLRSVSLTLTDFSDSTMPTKEVRALRFRGFARLKRVVSTDRINLLEPLPDLRNSIDAVLVTQGFDSIWSDDDIFYVKRAGTWYQGKCRLRVPKGDLHRDEVLAVLRGEGSDTQLAAKSFEIESTVFVEQILESVNSAHLPTCVRSTYRDHSNAAFWYPGGIIKKAEEAFNKVLTADGILVIADEASKNGGFCGEGYPSGAKSQHVPVQIWASMYHKLPSGAIYKHDEWPLAQQVLTARGYEVALVPLGEFIDSQIGGKHTDEFVPDIGNHVMIIRRR